MKNILLDLLANFYLRDLPAVTKRNIRYPEAQGSVTVITGMRRTGKTCLCYQKMRELLDSGVSKDRLLYLNFEDERLFGFALKDFQSILDVYYERYPDNRAQLCYFFFDEIQNIANWEMFIRRLLDSEKVQITITGSSSKMLTTEIGTAMRGRSLSTEVFPFSFEEFMAYHNIYSQVPRPGGDQVRAKLKNALNRYFLAGGFPEVQRNDPDSAISRLQDYVNVVMLRDVLERHQVPHTQALKHLVQAVFSAPAQKFSISNLCKSLKQLQVSCSREAIQSYIDYFCEAYLFYKVPLLTDSMARRRVNPDKLYIIDHGMIRAMALKTSADNGMLLENMVFLHLRRQGYIVNYVNTEKEKHEIDFYARHPVNKKLLLIQSSYQIDNEKTFQRECRSLIETGDYMKVDERLIVTWEDERELSNGIKVVPAWKFLLSQGPSAT
ncbi:MAG: ATP-binding protein [Lentisphaerota bacterium]